MKAPATLSSGGRDLWQKVTKDHPTLDATQLVQLEEACRSKDRLDKLDEVLRGDSDTWMRLARDLTAEDEVYELRITQALAQANATANLMKQLLAAMRLPDAATGKRPQVRSARGAYGAASTGGSVSSLDRARQRSGTA